MTKPTDKQTPNNNSRTALSRTALNQVVGGRVVQRNITPDRDLQMIGDILDLL